MTFVEKIDKLLKASKLPINTPSGLEKHIGASQSSIVKYYRENKYPGREIQKRIVEKLGVNQVWWDTGTGEIFLEQPEPARPKARPSSEFEDPAVVKLIQTLENTVASKNEEITRLEADKSWLKNHIDNLTVGLSSLKQA